MISFNGMLLFNLLLADVKMVEISFSEGSTYLQQTYNTINSHCLECFHILLVS